MSKDHFEKFTQDAKKVLLEAQRYSEQLQSDYIGTEHLLLGILSQERGLAVDILGQAGVNSSKLALILEYGSISNIETIKKSRLSEEAKKVLELALNLARKNGHFFATPEHILYSLLEVEPSNCTNLLKEINVDILKIKASLEELFSRSFPGGIARELAPIQASGGKTKTPALDFFSTDLTKLASQDKLDPVIGRTKEIERVIQILSRRTKNNPVLIGEPGVGKTAIVEGLSIKIANNEVPPTLLGKRILAIDLASMIAGTKYRGEFEERIKKILEEAKKNKEVILFIDEFHVVVGAGAAEGALDAANILKPALSRGEIQCIGATTLEEYRKNIEKDAALERRFQPVLVEEPSIEESIAILKGLRPKYEEFHNLKISDSAIEAAVKLSKRYISDRYLPDKAVDLIDEAASKKKIKKVVVIPEIKELKEKIQECMAKKEEAVERQDYQQAAEWRDREVELTHRIKEIEAEQEKKSFQELKITEEDIAEVVSSWTNIPVTKLIERESQCLLNLDEILKEKIIGQDEAIRLVSQAIKRSRVGITSPKRPIGSFIFLGPTGVGKTELAKVIAEQVFESEEALVKIDMSEFMERHNVARLVGAPPGYVGYEEAGKLTEAVRRRPYSVILLDEIEKAHPDVFNILLQILEDGYLTDAKGKKVDFRNTIIIMTSNIGVAELNRQALVGFRVESKDEKKAFEEKYEEIKKGIMGRLKEVFRPELLNRIDKVIVFKPLSKEAIYKIAQLQLRELQDRLKEQNIIIKPTKRLIAHLAEIGFDPENGARPLRRVIAEVIEDSLSDKLLKGEFKSGDSIEIDFKDTKVVFSKVLYKKTAK